MKLGHSRNRCDPNYCDLHVQSVEIVPEILSFGCNDQTNEPFFPSFVLSRTSICLIVGPVAITHSDAPTCKEGQKLSYGASIGETIAISCDVESSPSPSMFYWIFHSSLLTSSSTASPGPAPAPSSATSSHVREVIGSNGTTHSHTSEPSSSPSPPPFTSSRQNQSAASISSKAVKSLPTSASSASTLGRSKTHLFMSSPRTPNYQQSPDSDPNSRINNRNSGGNSLTSENQYNNNNNQRPEQQQYQQSHSGVSYSKLKYVSDGNRSWLYLTPKSPADFGTVQCWATNSIGRQRNACSFTVYPAGE